ncbi:Sec63 Brl domain-containing protein [Melampsora americana]|nr:Sec63 Brl domain-containing protein [Melampsora americana]
MHLKLIETIRDYIQADHHHQKESQLELQFEFEEDQEYRNLQIDEDYQFNLIQSNQNLSSQLNLSSVSISPNEFINWLKITISSYQSQLQSQGEEPLNLNQILDIIQSDQSQDLKSNQLLDLLGYHHLSLIEPILSNQSSIKQQAGSSHQENHHQTNNNRHLIKVEDPSQHNFDLHQLNQLKAKALLDASNRPLFTHEGFVQEAEINPHIFSSSASTNLNPTTHKYALPIGTTRTSEKLYEEISIPPAQKIPMRSDEELIEITDLDPIARASFPGYKSLNRLQSAVFPIAYKTNENMLVCAPTGAGKTDVAMLTILRAISQYSGLTFTNKHNSIQHIGKIRNDFKIIYVAPMKALAAEIVRKMGKRLSWLGLVVKELTGDMQLTKAEINSTHLIVTTPEKWDVVTRKASGEDDLVSKVRVLIIDEVHLLHEDRGAVIETIVARTLRQVESSQSLIRIVGLSATLPNYIDVSDFLRVNRMQGLFYFDSSFRPVPLEQHFIGVRGKPNSSTSRTNLDLATFEKVSTLVKEGHQVMVFVHARKETVKTSQMLRDKFMEESFLEYLDPSEHPKYDAFKRDLNGSRNKEMKELIKDGLGIHHAGMLRSDRTLSERLFESGITKVLCCTATLAWGVNLPAYAVVIKGTQIYDASKGSFVDLGILDVLQIFGRAGRPQYEDHGVGYICTTHDRLDHYVAAITQQHPIESQFISGIVDSLNAEIALGTVTTIDEGVQWIGWTYLFVRMRKNPMVYGLTIEDVQNDPLLGSKRHSLIVNAAKTLRTIGMIRFDEDLGKLIPNQLGIIASRYYIKHASIEIFVKAFREKMSEADVLAMISESVEFDQIKVRESESDELDRLQTEIPCQVKGGPTITSGKVNILLQAHVTRCYVDDFALVSDMAYVAQNAARISRALVEIAVSKRFAETSRVLIDIGKCIDKRMWPFAHPLLQGGLSDKLLYDLDQRAGDVEIEDLAQMSAVEIGKMCHLNEKLGGVILKAARQFPRLSIGYSLQPLSSELLRIKIDLSHEFDWSNQLHGQAEPFWIWIEDDQQREILRIRRVYLRPNKPEFNLEMVIPINPTTRILPDALAIRVMSDRWVGSDTSAEVDLRGIILPSEPPPFTTLLDLPLLSTKSLELAYCSRFLPAHLAPVETQCFHAINHTPADLLICASDLEVGRRMAMVATDRAIRLAMTREGHYQILIFSPTRSLARQLFHYFSKAFGSRDVKVDLIVDNTDLNSRKPLPKHNRCQVMIMTPEVGQHVTKSLSTDQTILSIFMGLHLLDGVYERLISKVKAFKSSRLIGFSSSLSDVRSISDWLGIPMEKQVYNFGPHVRVQPMTIDFEPIEGTHLISELRSSVKSISKSIRNLNSSSSVLIFLGISPACKIIGRALIQSLITQSDGNGRGRNEGLNEKDEAMVTSVFRDQEVIDLILHGLIVLNEGMKRNELEIGIELFRSKKVKMMMIGREMSWRLSNEMMKSEMVIVFGTEYIEKEKEKWIQEIRLGELIQMKSFVGQVESKLTNRKDLMLETNEEKFLVICGIEQLERYQKALEVGISIESMLEEKKNLEGLDELLYWLVDGGDRRSYEDHKGQEIGKRKMRDRNEVMRFVCELYIGNRVRMNPWYYGLRIDSSEPKKEELAVSRLVDQWIDGLIKRNCLKDLGGEGNCIEITRIGERLVKGKGSLRMIDWLKGLETKELMKKLKELKRIEVREADQVGEGQSEVEIESKGKDLKRSELMKYYNRLPRYVKELIGKDVEESEVQREEWKRKVLVIGFGFGNRIPFQDFRLEDLQAELIMEILRMGPSMKG